MTVVVAKVAVIKIAAIVAAAVVTVIASAVVITTLAANAQTIDQPILDLAVSPPVAYLKVRPGNRVEHSITLENIGPHDLSITPEVVDFSTDGLTNQPILGSSHSFPYFEDEARLKEPLLLPSQRRAQLTISMNVPSNAPEQEYPLTILFQGQVVAMDGDSADNDSADGNGANSDDANSDGATPITGVVGSNLILLVSRAEQLVQELSIDRVEVDQTSLGRIVDSTRPLVFYPIAYNQRPHAHQASGSAQITNWRGQVVADFDIYPDVVLGNDTRLLRAMVMDEAMETTPTEFRHDPGFLLGPYTISVSLANVIPGNPARPDLPDEPRVQLETYQFLILAWPLASLWVAGVIVGGVAIWYRKKIYETWQKWFGEQGDFD